MNKAVILLSLISFSVFAESDTLMENYENQLSDLLIELRSAESDEERSAANSHFKSKLEEVLAYEEALSYNFTKLGSIGVINSSDQLIRIINWNVENEDFSHSYHCYVLRMDPKKKKYFFKQLNDVSFGMPSMPTEIITGDQWYGALYYQIIPVKKGSRTLYTVLGWDHHNSMSTVKVVDVIYFSGSQVKLGNPMFKSGKTVTKRVFYEYAEKTSMLLTYEEERDRIMMDHLSPESPSMANFREFYVPDLSYDALEYDGKRWVLKEDVIGTNPGNNQNSTDEVYTMDENGYLVEQEVETEWEDPSNPNAPAGGNIHVAVTPEGDPDSQKKNKGKKRKEKEEIDPNAPKVDKRDKRDPSQLSTVNGRTTKKWWQRKKKKN